MCVIRREAATGHDKHPAQGAPAGPEVWCGGFGRDKAGSVGVIFGLVVIPLTAFIGLAVDFGRVYAVKSQTQSALDAAALAAGRVAQVEKIDTAQQGLGGRVAPTSTRPSRPAWSPARCSSRPTPR